MGIPMGVGRGRGRGGGIDRCHLFIGGKRLTTDITRLER